MIARVRRRVRANSVTVDKEKTAQSVCLLSAILLLPYCPRGPLPLLPSPAPVLYSALVLPVVLSANYRYPVPTLKTLGEAVKSTYIFFFFYLHYFRINLRNYIFNSNIFFYEFQRLEIEFYKCDRLRNKRFSFFSIQNVDSLSIEKLQIESQVQNR